MGSDLVVGDIMKNKIVIAPTDATIIEVCRLMKKHDVGSVIITEADDERNAVGIITERDIVWKVVAFGKPLSIKSESVMSTPIRVVRMDAPIEEAARIMKKYNIKRLPVVNNKGELVGIISETDIARVFPSVIDVIEERMSI